MNVKVTSKDEILKNAREIISTKSVEALSIRSLAAKCNVATGSLYNYFPSKEDLIFEAVVSVWKDVFDLAHIDECCFTMAVDLILENIERGKKTYPNFFKLHSLNFSKKGREDGRDFMDLYFKRIKRLLRNILETDSKVQENIFDTFFTREAYVEIIFNLIVSSFIRDIDRATAILMIEKTIYIGG